MRIDAETTSYMWTVHHGVTREVLHHVLWADDVSAQWCTADDPLRIDIATGDIASTVHQAKRILILPALLQIIIDPQGPANGPEIPPEVHNHRPISADQCMAAVRAMCGVVR